MIGPGQGEVVGDSADRRVEILADSHALEATWSRFAAGRDGADLHVHRRHTDHFYVLTGELELRLGTEDARRTLLAGCMARIPPMVVHGFRNASDGEVTYLNLHAPGTGFADYMRSIRDGDPITYDQEPPPESGLRPATDAVIGARADTGARSFTHASDEPLRVSESLVGAGQSRRLSGAGGLFAYVLDGSVELDAGAEPLAALAGSWIALEPEEEISARAGAGVGARLLELAPQAASRT